MLPAFRMRRKKTKLELLDVVAHLSVPKGNKAWPSFEHDTAAWLVDANKLNPATKTLRNKVKRIMVFKRPLGPKRSSTCMYQVQRDLAIRAP